MKHLLTLTAIILSLSTYSQKKEIPQVEQPKVNDSTLIVSINDFNLYLQSINPKALTKYEFDLLQKSFQEIINEAIRRYAAKSKQK